MTKKLLSVLALAVVLATTLVRAEVFAKWGVEALASASRVVAVGPFLDIDG